MAHAFQELIRRDGTPIQVPSIPSLSAEAPEAFVAACCGQRITGAFQTIPGTSLRLWHWDYCSCMAEAVAYATERRQAAEAHAAQHEVWRARQSRLDALFPQWMQSQKASGQTMDTFRMNNSNRAVVERVHRWIADPGAAGFLLLGPVGCGKTHLLRAVTHALRGRDQTVLAVSVPYLLERLRGPSAVEMAEVLKAVRQADVMVWDDLGAERPTEWTLDRLYLLVDTRYEVEKPLVMTSNWSLDALADRLDDRIMSRLLGMGPVWELSGPDQRVAAAMARRSTG